MPRAPNAKPGHLQRDKVREALEYSFRQGSDIVVTQIAAGVEANTMCGAAKTTQQR